MGLVKAKIRKTKTGSGASDDMVGLSAALQAADPAERRSAARRLGSTTGCEAALLDRLAFEHEASVREMLVLSLMQLGTQDAVRGLAEHLRSEDASLRNAVVEALEAMPDAVAPNIELLLADHDPDVRIFACNLLVGLAHPDVPKWLSHVLENDSHVNVCAAAVDALTEIGRPDCVPALRACARRFPEEPFLSFAIDVAIARAAEQ
ncbi:HEAT repeat domain-containing protein [Consotaella salsifontis]|uniref:HEAT repeat-containing protein n=1 Tax=Consotaella salsifontis TaxID=1365950 RepID=A0A1T4STM3_9HYPH|nr:HEAT repeat domain-containing protein [Consotaella salsifontis]SKA31527.1 HEAT repeat-containing protein [Consotaella salsifontis]